MSRRDVVCTELMKVKVIQGQCEIEGVPIFQLIKFHNRVKKMLRSINHIGACLVRQNDSP